MNILTDQKTNTETSVYESYKINSVYWMVCDKINQDDIDRLDFHAENNDYFSTLATLLGFVEEAMVDKNSDKSVDNELKLLQQIKKDLLYLNDNYQIVKK